MKKIEAVWKGLEILSKYSNNIQFEHIVLVAGPETADDMSDEDCQKLEDMGWICDDITGWEIIL